METDRHTPDGEDRGEATASSPHEYSYGEASSEGASSLGSDGGTPADGGTDGAPRTDADADADADSHTSVQPGATALRGGTAPRAVLRPVPEGFPTPPPRPARPNRRPAKQPDPAPSSRRPSRGLIAALAIVAALLLVVVVGGGILAMRSLSATDPAPAAGDGSAQPTQDPSAPGAAEIGGASVTEVSTEVGVRAVGGQASRLEPEGEYVIVTFEVDNTTEQNLSIGGDLTLEAADGPFPIDAEATREHQADSTGYGIVNGGETRTFHAVFDVPLGTDPTGLTMELADQSGTLPLSG